MLLLQEIVKRHDDDGLNLKTPGPKPHPSWVYRHHFTQEERTEVQRSLSVLQHARNKSGTTAAFQRVELLGPLPKLPSRDLSPPQIATISDKVDAGTMRHAIIRRHNSMYASSTRTVGPNPFQPPYKLHDVSGASEVRPIVTLQRSKTSITPGSLYYRSSSIQGIARQVYTTHLLPSSDSNALCSACNVVRIYAKVRVSLYFSTIKAVFSLYFLQMGVCILEFLVRKHFYKL